MSKEELIQDLRDINSSFANDINAKLNDLPKDLASFHQNMTNSILNCANVKPPTLIYLSGSFSWSVTLLLIANTVDERPLN